MSFGSGLGITFAGLGSGIDTDSIVQRLIQIESLPIQRLQIQQAQIQKRQTLFGQLRSNLQALSGAAAGLNSDNAFNPIKATTSDSSVASISGNSGGVAGTYALKVFQLAQANKLSSSAQTDSASALGLSGTFVVDGKSVTIEASDSLTAVASKINSSGAGVTASIINGGTGQNYLTLTAKASGAAKKIDLSDTSGNVLSTLGLTQTQVRSAITNGAKSLSAVSATTKLSSLFDLDGIGATNITINGQTINLDPETDTLTSLAGKINALAGVHASVVSQQEFGTTTYRLEITGDSGTPSFGSEGNFWLNLGVLKRSGELVAAQDAKYQLDTIALSSDSNTITTAIPGATLNLLKANPIEPAEATLTLTRDLDGVKSAVSAFVQAYNSIQTFMQQNSQFDKENFSTGALFGDSVASQVETSIANLLFNDVAGTTTQYKNLSQLGFAISDTGQLSFDEARLTEALANDPDAVANLLKTTGKTSSTAITYVSSTPKTVVSAAGDYQINITQLATKGSIVGTSASSEGWSQTEKLTFGGNLFGNTSFELTILAGSSLDSVVSQINNDPKLRDQVVASNAGGHLKLESKRFGTAGNFSVVSDLTAEIDNSGIGTSGQSSYTSGVDIAGTINGEAATGNGQFLTGNAGNANTDGLQIQYTGSTTGNVGSIRFTKGVASKMFDMMDGFINGQNSLLTATDTALQKQIDDISLDIASLEERITLKQASLKARFTAMEQAISNAQAQGQRLTAMFGR